MTGNGASDEDFDQWLEAVLRRAAVTDTPPGSDPQSWCGWGVIHGPHDRCAGVLWGQGDMERWAKQQAIDAVLQDAPAPVVSTDGCLNSSGAEEQPISTCPYCPHTAELPEVFKHVVLKRRDGDPVHLKKWRIPGAS